MRFHKTGVLRFVLAAALLGVSLTRASALTVTASYVKTLGQSNADGKFSFSTAGGRVAVDEQGNAYFGTPGGGSTFQKVSPKGEILWQFSPGLPGFQGAAVDDKYLYTCGVGYYGLAQLQRWSRETGEAAAGWQYQWKDKATPVDGVSALILPNALAVDDKYLFVADLAGNEVRRFDKASGKEVPFAQRLLVVSPTDLAFTPQGTLLVLTESTVIEVSKDGVPLRVPVIDGLRTPTALDVNRKNGAIYIAEGGDAAAPVNRVRIFNPDGKLTSEIGTGGDFNGPWTPLSFGFSSGAGDVALDADGGFWVNGYGHRLWLLPVLTHVKAAPQIAPDVILRGVAGSGLAVDSNLDVYVGGSYKIGWDDQLKWTSGLVTSTATFPTTLAGWTLLPVWSDGKTAIICSPSQGFFYQVNALNGAALGKSVPTGSNDRARFCVVGQDVFYTGQGRTIQRTTLDLSTPTPFMTLPEAASPATGAIAVGPDEQLVYLSNEGELACYRRDGAQVWKAKGSVGALWKGVLFSPNPDGPGVAALDAATGVKIAVFGDKEENGRAAINSPAIVGMAIGSRDGADYLFIQTNARVLVYRINAA